MQLQELLLATSDAFRALKAGVLETPILKSEQALAREAMAAKQSNLGGSSVVNAEKAGSLEVQGNKAAQELSSVNKHPSTDVAKLEKTGQAPIGEQNVPTIKKFEKTKPPVPTESKNLQEPLLSKSDPAQSMSDIAKKLGFKDHEIAQLENVGKIEEALKNPVKNDMNSAQDLKFVNHGIKRAVERGVSRESIKDALKSLLKIEEIKIDNFGRPSQRFIGQKAEIVINPETQQIVSVNPTSTKKLEKLSNELDNVKNRAE